MYYVPNESREMAAKEQMLYHTRKAVGVFCFFAVVSILEMG